MPMQDRLSTDFALMRDIASATDSRSAEIRSLLATFIGRVGAVPATVWSGAAAVRFREVVDRWNAESERLCHALDAIADTVRANERILAEAASAHDQRISSVGADVRGL
ncbi:MAG: WXG100 family type VII secretion target [Mycobacterium sp.]|nr:WXG100 family type VII secretion target [Mycobacterium sp.]